MFNGIFNEAFFSISIRLGNIFVAFLLYVQVSRHLGKDSFGLFIFLANVSLFVSVLSSFGLGRIALQMFSTSKYVDTMYLRVQLFNNFLLLWVIISAIMSFLAFALYVLFSPMLPFVISWQVAILSILYGVLVGWRIIVVDIYISNKHAVSSALFDGFLSNFILVLVLSVAHFFTLGVFDLKKVLFLYVVVVCIVQLVSFFRINSIINRSVFPGASGCFVRAESMVEILAKARYSFYNKLGMNIANLSDVWVLGVFSTAFFIADYGVASKVATFISFLLVSLNSFIPPYFSRYIEKGDVVSLESVCRVFSTLVAVPSFVLAIMLFFLGGDLVAFVFGASYSSAGDVLKVLILMHIANVLAGPSSSMLVMHGRNKELMKISLSTSFFAIGVALVLGVNGVGAMAIVWCFVSATVVRQFVVWLLVKRLCGVNTCPVFSVKYFKLHLRRVRA